jgi:hypothetical protein
MSDIANGRAGRADVAIVVIPRTVAAAEVA